MATNGLTLDDLQIKISVQSSGASKSLKNLTKALEQLAGVKTVNLDGIIKQMQDLQAQTSKITDSVASAWKTLSGKVGDASKEFNDSLDESKDHLGEVEEQSWSLADSLKDSFSYVSGAFGGITQRLGKLTGAIKRIAFYRLIRSAIKALTQALKEGVNMLIEWDRAYGKNTSYAAKTADEIATKWREVKKTLGAAAMPLIQIFQPALMSVMQTVINVVNTINQALRSFQGFTTYIKATDQGFKKATGSAKALKNVLFGFDELNVLPDASGSGGGAEVGAIDFEETAITENVSKITAAFEGVKKFIDDLKLSFDGLWEVLGGKAKIVFGLLGGDVKTVFEGLKQYVHGWGGIIAGIFKSLLSAVGRLLEPVYRWIYEHIFRPIGDGLDWLNGFAKTAWEVTKATFIYVWTGISNWFKDSFVPTMKYLPTIIWESIKTGVTVTAEFFKNVWNVTTTWVKDNVITPVEGFFSGLWQRIKDGAKNAWDGIKSVFGVVTDWFRTKFTDAWTAVKNVFSTGGKIFDGIKEGIVNAFKTVVNAIIRGLNKVISIPFNAINNVLAKIRDISIFSIQPFKNLVKTISIPQIPLLASGGFIPNMGSLFMAGEAGAELVAHAPGGTEVLNGNQVEQAMANANMEVVNAIYAMANMVVGAVNNKNFDVYMDSAKVGKSVTQYQNAQQRRLGTAVI